LRTRKGSKRYDQGGTDNKYSPGDKTTQRNPKPTVYELKLQNLSKGKAEVLRKAFLEAKWLYNWLVSDTERLGIPPTR